jgi:hypothetical protein
VDGLHQRQAVEACVYSRCACLSEERA